MRSEYIIESIRTPRGKAKDSGGLHDINSFELLDYLYKYLGDAEILDKNKIYGATTHKLKKIHYIF